MSLFDLLHLPVKDWANLYVNSISSDVPISGITGSFSTTLSGPWASGVAITVGLYRIGDIISILLPSVLAASAGSAFITLSGIPSSYRPAVSVTLPILLVDNNVNVMGSITISPSGT